MTTHWSFGFLFSFLCSVAVAQTCIYSSGAEPVNPGGVDAPLIQPWGVGQIERTHLLFPAGMFQNVPVTITDFSVAVRAGWRKFRCTELTIRMGHTTVSQLGAVYAQNITSPLQDVLVVRDHVWTQGIGPGWVAVGLQQSFQFLPGSGNLLIEIVARDTTLLEQFQNQWLDACSIGTRIGTYLANLPLDCNCSPSPAPRLRFCVDRAETLVLGQTCAGSGTSTPLLGVSGRPTPGAAPTIWLSDAPANAIAACAYGFDTRPPYPVNLTSLGAPGCRQYFPVAFADVVLANAIGVGQRTIVVPSAPATIGAILYTQYYVLDPPANALDLTTSNYARLLVGL